MRPFYTSCYFLAVFFRLVYVADSCYFKDCVGKNILTIYRFSYVSWWFPKSICT